MSFRGYADYRDTGEFRKALSDLMLFAKKNRLAYMCAEAVPWKCHRQLISDALTERGFKVQHIIGIKTQTHTLRPKAGQVEFEF